MEAPQLTNDGPLAGAQQGEGSGHSPRASKRTNEELTEILPEAKSPRATTPRHRGDYPAGYQDKFQLQVLTKFGPHWCQGFLTSSHFEVIDVIQKPS